MTNSTWGDPIILLGCIGTVVTIIYTVLTALIWNATAKNTEATKDVLEAAHRPYIGVMSVDLKHEHHTDNGRLVVGVENVGSVPARRIIIAIEITMPGGTGRAVGDPDMPQIALFPGQEFSCSTTLSTEEALLVRQGGDGLAALVKVHYQGMTQKKYTTSSTYAYTNEVNGFSVRAGHFD